MSDKIQQIRELAKLKEEGILTEEEFQKQKAELLSAPSQQSAPPSSTSSTPAVLDNLPDITDSLSDEYKNLLAPGEVAHIYLPKVSSGDGCTVQKRSNEMLVTSSRVVLRCENSAPGCLDQKEPRAKTGKFNEDIPLNKISTVASQEITVGCTQVGILAVESSGTTGSNYDVSTKDPAYKELEAALSILRSLLHAIRS